MFYSVADVLKWTGGRVVNASVLGTSLEKIRVSRPVSLSGSKSGDVAFFFSPNFKHELPLAAPGVLITGDPFVKPLESAGLPLWKSTAVVACVDPYLAMALVTEHLAPANSTVAHLPGAGAEDRAGKPEVHPTAVIAASAELGAGVKVGPHCVIEERARIGARTILYPGCYLGTEAVIGEDSVLFPRVTVYEMTRIGNRVRLHSGVVLGADGFGYAPKKEGNKVVGHQKIYHVGRVVIGDDVEIGANTCVDRATFGETRIERSAKLDNMIQIGHNAHVDEGAIMCGCSAIAGTGSVGKFAYIGGGAGIANQIHAGDGSNVAAYTLVTKDVPPGATVIGNPMRDHREYFKIHALMSRMLAERKKK